MFDVSLSQTGSGLHIFFYKKARIKSASDDCLFRLIALKGEFFSFWQSKLWKTFPQSCGNYKRNRGNTCCFWVENCPQKTLFAEKVR